MIRPKYSKQPRRVRKTYQSPADSKAAYTDVALRSGGICEACGEAPAREMHHRRYRSRGGRDEVVNLLHVCGHGNADGCHGVAHTGAGEAKGLSVRSMGDPATTPVLYRGHWRLLLPAAPWFVDQEVPF